MQSAYLHKAANTSLYACNRYAEDIKLAKFHDRVQLEGLDYLPFETSRLLEVNLNDIKKLHLPDTRGWTFKLTDRALIRNKAVLIDLIP